MRSLPVARPIERREVDEQHFLYLLEAIFQNALNETGNPGQIAILDELFQKTEQVFENSLAYGQRLTPIVVKSIIVLAIGSEKANAISIIIDEMADQICLAWDDSVKNDENTTTRIFKKTTAADYLKASMSINAWNYRYRAGFINGRL